MPVPVRADFDATRLRACARAGKDAGQARRLLALAAIYEGATRTEAAKIGGVTLQIVRDWVMRFNERGPAGLVNGKAPGQQSRLNDQQRAVLAQAIERGPTPPISTALFAGGRAILAQWLWEEFRVSVSDSKR